MKKYEFTSHETFGHDSIDSLGYDWSRVADPNLPPLFPTKVYLPRTTEHIVQALQEVALLKQDLKVRSKGHSSNDLVLTDGAVLCTEQLNNIVEVNTKEKWANVQSGIVLADLDDHLAPLGFGLPVIGDHNHITAGGFASVGGISPGSHRYGLFIDNILELELVTWEGQVVRCGPDEHADLFRKALAGTGRYGVLATLKCRILPMNKAMTVLKNDRQIVWSDVDRYIKLTHERIRDPGEAQFERGVWVDYPMFVGTLRVGQFSSYHTIRQGYWSRFRRWISYGYLHTLGYWAGRLPNWLDVIVKYLGTLGVIYSPKYANVKDIESFTDKVLETTVGDPTRMLIVLAPIDRYDVLFRRMYDFCLTCREKEEAITFIAFYVKAIRSNYLAPKGNEGKFAELMLYLGVRPDKMAPAILNELVWQMDELCIEHGALRYMHSKTTKDIDRLHKIDPNYLYVTPQAETNDTR